MVISTDWSVSCLLFFYSRFPRAKPFVKERDGHENGKIELFLYERMNGNGKLTETETLIFT